MSAPDLTRSAIQVTCEIASETAATWTEHQRLGTTTSRLRVTAKVEQLVHFLIAEFAGAVTHGEIQKVIVEEGDKLSPEYLQGLRSAAVPLAIMRALLAERGLEFDVRGVPSWSVFADRYGEAILAVTAPEGARCSATTSPLEPATAG